MWRRSLLQNHTVGLAQQGEEDDVVRDAVEGPHRAALLHDRLFERQVDLLESLRRVCEHRKHRGSTCWHWSGPGWKACHPGQQRGNSACNSRCNSRCNRQTGRAAVVVAESEVDADARVVLLRDPAGNERLPLL